MKTAVTLKRDVARSVSFKYVRDMICLYSLQSGNRGVSAGVLTAVSLID